LKIIFMHAFGLDLSDASLKLIELRLEGQNTELANFCDLPLAEGVIVKGRIVKEDLLATSIKEVLKKAQKGEVKNRFVVSCVPESESFVRIISLPSLPEEELAQGVRWEFEQHIPLSLDQVYLDWQKIESEEEEIKVLVAASPKKLVDAYTSVLKKGGLIPWAIEAESAASARSLIKEGDPACFLLVDIGFSRTSLIIYDHKTLQFTSAVELFGQSFTNKLTENLKVGLKEAESLKRIYGLSSRKKGPSEKVHQSLLPLVRSLAEEIRTALKFYSEHFPRGQTVKKIVLSGGGSKLKGLVPELKAILKTDVTLGNPWVNILDPDRKYLPEINRKDALSYATAIGLALRGMEGL